MAKLIKDQKDFERFKDFARRLVEDKLGNWKGTTEEFNRYSKILLSLAEKKLREVEAQEKR